VKHRQACQPTSSAAATEQTPKETENQ